MSQVQYVWKNIKDSAKNRTKPLAMNLTKPQVWALANMPCFYCGAEPALRERTEAHQAVAFNGIDRIDNDRAYEPDNVLPCCRRCNWAKGQDSLEVFMAWVEEVRGFSPGGEASTRIAQVQAEMADTAKWEANVLASRGQATPGTLVVDSLGNEFASITTAARFHNMKHDRVSRIVRGLAPQPKGFVLRLKDTQPANDNGRTADGGCGTPEAR